MKIKFLWCLVALFSSLAFGETSQEVRALKKYEGTVQLGYDYHMTTTQLGFAKFLDANNVIGIKIGETEEDDYQFSSAIQYKHFVGNSFYVATNAYYVNFTEEHWFWTEDYDKSTALGVNFRIGNQWQWNDFTIGCDWFGFGRDLIFFSREGDDVKTTYTALNAYIGLSY